MREPVLSKSTLQLLIFLLSKICLRLLLRVFILVETEDGRHHPSQQEVNQVGGGGCFMSTLRQFQCLQSQSSVVLELSGHKIYHILYLKSLKHLEILLLYSFKDSNVRTKRSFYLKL